MFKIKLEQLSEEIEQSLPEQVRLIRSFYFIKLEGSKDGRQKNENIF